MSNLKVNRGANNDEGDVYELKIKTQNCSPTISMKYDSRNSGLHWGGENSGSIIWTPQKNIH